MDKINILGVNIDNLTQKQALNKISEYLIDGRQHQIITPNPEIILTAVGHDEELFYILNKADLSVADGVGLKIAAWLMGVNLDRVAGADLLTDILAAADEQNRRVAVFNWSQGLSNAKDIERALKEKYPGLEAKVFDAERKPSLPESILAQAREFKPEVIFSALGAPYQEKFIFHNLPDLPSAKIGLGVGGAFDFLTGKLPRAPLFMRKIGLEWLWRLIKQPWRWRRIYNAVIVFPCKFLIWRFILPWRYRENAACLLYKMENGKFKILIVERADQPGHWQIPQGGVDGQELTTAGLRELSEELNTDKFRFVAVFKVLHAYEFGKALSKYGVSAKKASGYRGQKQGLLIAEFSGTDSDIKINFWEHSAWRWVEAEKLIETVHPVRRRSAKIFMEKFWKIINKKNI